MKRKAKLKKLIKTVRYLTILFLFFMSGILYIGANGDIHHDENNLAEEDAIEKISLRKQSESEAHPSESEAHPSESEAHPSESETHPSESETHPSESEAHPSESETHPSGSETYPSESETHPSGDQTKSSEANIEKQGGDQFLGRAEDLTEESHEDQSFSENDGKININTAGIEELKTLPGIGEKNAERIISYREDMGSFKTIEDLMKIERIGEKTFTKVKDLIKTE